MSRPPSEILTRKTSYNLPHSILAKLGQIASANNVTQSKVIAMLIDNYETAPELMKLDIEIKRAEEEKKWHQERVKRRIEELERDNAALQEMIENNNRTIEIERKSFTDLEKSLDANIEMNKVQIQLIKATSQITDEETIRLDENPRSQTRDEAIRLYDAGNTLKPGTFFYSILMAKRRGKPTASEYAEIIDRARRINWAILDTERYRNAINLIEKTDYTEDQRNEIYKAIEQNGGQIPYTVQTEQPPGKPTAATVEASPQDPYGILLRKLDRAKQYNTFTDSQFNDIVKCAENIDITTLNATSYRNLRNAIEETRLSMEQRKKLIAAIGYTEG